MIIQLGFVLPTGAIVLLAFLYLRKADSTDTASNWAWALVSLYVAGITVALVDLWDGFMALSIVANTLFVGFIFAGALAFARREQSWVLPLSLALGVIRGGAFFAGYEILSMVLGLCPVWIMSLAAVVVVARAARDEEATPPDRMLAPVLAANAALTAAAPIVPVLRLDTLPLVVLWANIGVLLAVLQLMALHERRRRAQDLLLTEMKRQAMSLEEERIMLEALIDAVPAGIMLIDGDGVIRNMNRLGAENFSLGDPAAWVGRRSLEVFENLAPLLTADSVERIQSSIDRADRNFSYDDRGREIRLRKPDERTFILYSRPVLSADGSERIGEAWVSWNVTEQRMLSERLQQAKRMETLGTLAGGVAHDFNNQLTPILGNAEFLTKALPDDPSLQEAARDLIGAAEHCAELTRDLLAVGQRTPAQPCSVDAREIIDEVANPLRSTLGPQVELKIEIEEDTWPLRADPTQLKRVITNLFVNARDAVGTEGCIEIRARNVSPASAMDAPQWVEIEVRDDGEGIDREARDHIFDPFFSTKPRGRGTGLGLSIVYGIVELHGATIDVDSHPGGGACFRMRWPADDAPRTTEDPTVLENASARGHETILLVDDEERIVRLARRGLELHGYRVLSASDGDEGLRVYLENENQIDLVIVDFTMPGRDGVALLAMLRSQSPSLPAVLMSGNLECDQLSDPQLDATFVAKPFRPEELAIVARQTLDAQSRPARNDSSSEHSPSPGASIEDRDR